MSKLLTALAAAELIARYEVARARAIAGDQRLNRWIGGRTRIGDDAVGMQPPRVCPDVTIIACSQ